MLWPGWNCSLEGSCVWTLVSPSWWHYLGLYGTFRKWGTATRSRILECVCAFGARAGQGCEAWDLQPRPTVLYHSASCHTHMWISCLMLHNHRCSSVLPPRLSVPWGLHSFNCKPKPSLPFLSPCLSGFRSLQQEKLLIYWSIMFPSTYSKLWCVL